MTKISALMAILAFSSAANAATVSFASSGSGLAPTEINETLQLGLFDSSLGTLSNVQLSLNTAAQFSFTATNTSTSAAQSFQITPSVGFFYGSSLSSLNSILFTLNNTLFASPGVSTLLPGASDSFGPLSDSETISLDSQLDGILNAFSVAGGGALLVNCISFSGITIQGGGGNIATSNSTLAECGAEITYTYQARGTEIPEPASLALLGLGLAGIRLSSRNKLKNQRSTVN